jgi:hypothetical protein
MTARVAIDNVPTLVRPAEVEQAIVAAQQMRERVAEQAEAVAAAQHAVDEAERQDVEAAARRARAGEPLGASSRALVKARDVLLLAQRDSNALRLAQQQAEDDLAQVIAKHADAWLEELHRAAEQARARAVDALEQFERDAHEISASGGAAIWLRSGQAEGRFDRAPGMAVVGTIAVSSRRRTANNEPLRVDELVGYLRELIEPPTSTPAPMTTGDMIVVTT